jgi:hypothetical protein
MGNNVNSHLAFGGGLPDDDWGDWVPPNWSSHRRGRITSYDPNNFFSLWPSSPGFQTGDPSALTMAPQRATPSWLSYDTLDGLDGIGTQKFIKGTVTDASDVPIAGAVVKAYLTATDLEVGSDTSGVDGTYEVGTPYTGAHYCVAYLDTVTDQTGATVNTLIPTSRDGT